MGMGRAGKGAVKVFMAAVVFSFSGFSANGCRGARCRSCGIQGAGGEPCDGPVAQEFPREMQRQRVDGRRVGIMTSILFLFANKLTTAANAIVLQYAMRCS